MLFSLINQTTSVQETRDAPNDRLSRRHITSKLNFPGVKKVLHERRDKQRGEAQVLENSETWLHDTKLSLTRWQRMRCFVTEASDGKIAEFDQ